MKPHSNFDSSCKGSVILYVLVLIAIVSLLFVGWIELLTARGQTTDILTYSIKRRIAAQNANAILRQYLTSNELLTNTGNLSLVSLAGGWGGVEVATWAKSATLAYPYTARENPFNPGNLGNYTLSANLTWTITIEEEDPSLLVTENATANTTVRTHSWTDLSAWFAANSGSNTIDAATLTKNATTAPLGVTSNNSTKTVTIDLTAAPPVVIINNSTTCTITGNATPAAAASPAISILIDNFATTALANITFIGDNYQPLYLALRNPVTTPPTPRINWNFTSGASWKMTSVLQEAPVQINNAPTIDGFILAATLNDVNGDVNINGSAITANTTILQTQGWDEIYAP